MTANTTQTLTRPERKAEHKAERNGGTPAGNRRDPAPA